MRRWTGDRFVGVLEPGEERPMFDLPRLRSYDPSRVTITFNGHQLPALDGAAVEIEHPAADAEELL